jgi:hypothetical protein
MKLNIVGFVLASALLGILSQAPEHSDANQKSPKQIVEEYWKMETSGGRLTPEGWRAANQFQIRPVPPPKERSIVVVDDDASVWKPVISGDSADVTVGVRKEGTIDSNLKFVTSDGGAVKEGIVFHLVRTDKYSSGAENQPEHHSAMEWRFEKSGTVIWLTASSAIRYIDLTSAKTADPIVKQNAARTIAILKRHLH